MAKEKFKSYEAAKEALAPAREKLKAAKDERRAFEKENKLAKETDHSADEKHGKKWAKLNATVVAAQAEVDSAKEFMDANKPKKEKAGRASTYEYPKEVVTVADKKKYRAKMRADKKRAEKGEAAPEKKDKGSKEEGGKDKKKKKNKDKEKTKSED